MVAAAAAAAAAGFGNVGAVYFGEALGVAIVGELIMLLLANFNIT